MKEGCANFTTKFRLNFYSLLVLRFMLKANGNEISYNWILNHSFLNLIIALNSVVAFRWSSFFSASPKQHQNTNIIIARPISFVWSGFLVFMTSLKHFLECSMMDDFLSPYEALQKAQLIMCWGNVCFIT